MGEYEPTVFVVDNDKEVCKSISFLVNNIGLNVQTFYDPLHFLDAYKAEQSGCLVADMLMPNLSGFELNSRLVDKGINLPTIIITGHADVAIAVEAMKRGIVDYIEKPFNNEFLCDAINRAIRQDSENRAMEDFKAKFSVKVSSLTRRESDIADLLIEGKPNKEISYQLGISSKTVHFHRNNILDKMAASSIVDLIILVYRAHGAQAMKSISEQVSLHSRRKTDFRNAVLTSEAVNNSQEI